MSNTPVSGELPPPIGEEEQLALVKKLKSQYDHYRSQVSPLHAKIDAWHAQYEAERGPKKDFPWPDASNYTVPLTMATVDSIHARIVKAVFEVDPLWLAKPRAPESVDKAKKAEAYLDYWADEMDLGARLDMNIHNMLIEGVGVLKVDWVRLTREIPAKPQRTPQGEVPAATVVTEYEGPSAHAVPLKDFVLIPADAPTIEEAVYVGHRVYRTHGQLLERQRAGFYFNVDTLLEKSQGDSTSSRAAHASSVLSGTQGQAEHEETRQYEVVELYGPFDWGDGPAPTLFAFSPQHEVLLRIEPYPYEYGRAPYVDFKIFPRPNFFWARSVPEILESAQEELTALHNMRADAIVRRIAPPLLLRRGSGWNPEETPWQPGQVIEVTDPAELIELNMSDVPGSLFAHEQDVLAFVERVTGQSDYFMGRSPSQGRTATEVNRVTSEGLARMDVSVSRFQKGMKKLAWVLWWLLFQYRPYIDTFAVNNEPHAISKDEMRPSATGLMPFEFIPQGELSDASKEARRQQLIFLLQASSGPLSQFYPDGIQKLLGEVFHSFDIQNKDEILGPPWGVIQQMMQQAMQQGFQEGVKQGADAQGEAA